MKGFVRSLLAAALIGTTVSTQASAICLLAGLGGTVASAGPSRWLYSFTVYHGCGGNLTDFFLPYFSDAGIADITVPATVEYYPGRTVSWSASIDPGRNLFGLAGAGVIDFHATVSPEFPGAPGLESYTSSGFSFTAGYGSVEGPVAFELATVGGGDSFVFADPPIPGSPLTIAALGGTAAPEPATFTLLATALVGMGAVARRRKSA